MRRKHQPPTIEILVESSLWRAKRSAKAVLRRALGQAFSAVPAASGELAVVLTDDAAMRVLNRKWRRKQRPTNVLSFPADARHRGSQCLLGDVVIAYETTEREARAQRKPFTHHLAHLAVHGFLHLAGYDHDAKDQAEAMERLETQILARLDIPNPYIVRDATVAS